MKKVWKKNVTLFFATEERSMTDPRGDTIGDIEGKSIKQTILPSHLLVTLLFLQYFWYVSNISWR